MGRMEPHKSRFPEGPPHDGICLYTVGPHRRCMSKSKDHGIGFQFCDMHWDPSLIYRTQE
jgi:hypothetical protein